MISATDWSFCCIISTRREARDRSISLAAALPCYGYRLDVECQKSSMDRMMRRGGAAGAIRPCG